MSLEEGDVRLDLNVLDLPGFGDDIDNSRYSFLIYEYGCKVMADLNM